MQQPTLSYGECFAQALNCLSPVQAEIGVFLIQRFGQCYPHRARHTQHICSKTFSFPRITFQDMHSTQGF